MAKYSFFILLLLLTPFFFLNGCINNVEDISSNLNINPGEISYSEHIQPIFSNSCGGSDCHIPNSQNGVNLSSYTAVINSVGISYGKSVVVPGNADESPLIDKIEPSPQFGVRMPSNGNYLTPDEINRIKAWINNGAEDN